MPKLDEFRDALKIDKHALDDEIVRQPALFQEVGDAYAQAVASRDAFKEALATVDAQLDGEARAAYADEKVTEAQIKSEVQTDDRHVKAAKAFLTAKMDADRWGVLKEAFQQRSFMLRDLTSLYIAGYYQSQSVRPTQGMSDTVYEHRKEKLRQARRGYKAD